MRRFSLAVAVACSVLAGATGAQNAARAVEQGATGDGVVKVRSAYPFAETIARLKADIGAKKIQFFLDVDQSKLAADAGIALHPSTLLMFGNPPLGTQFITAKPEAGLDWPVRLLVSEATPGEVTVSYTDFAWIARRHAIGNREAQFKMASEVIASITGSVAGSKARPAAN